MNAQPEVVGPVTDDTLGKLLLTLARGWIGHALGGPDVVIPDDARLLRPGATFVTLTHGGGQLHGCIGSLEPRRPLVADVRSNALAAAFLDPRSAPLRARQLRDVCIEISLLGPLSPLAASSEAEAIALMRPHEDGVVLSWGPVRGVLLPQVWEKIPDPATFLRALKAKAGLPADFWSNEVELRRFGLVKWREERKAHPKAHAHPHPYTPS
jgi:AmmeMemoRadiSam system protein A